MRIIENFDSNNYEMCTGHFNRIAVRAIIIKNNLLALIKSEKYGSLGLREQNYQYLADLGELNHDSFIADVGCGNG